MKHITFKRVVSSLIVIIVGVIAGIYFLGGLRAHDISFDDIDFSLDGFKDFSTGQLDAEGNPIVLEYNRHQVVGQSDKYVMLFDESTTIASVVTRESYETAKATSQWNMLNVVFETASSAASKGTDQQKLQAANLVLNYVTKSNGKDVNDKVRMNSFSNSVRFKNTLTDQDESYYKVKYLVENGEINGVQILYEIGNFSAGQDYFPKAFRKAIYRFSEDPVEMAQYNEYNRDTLEERFRGNTQFNYQAVLNEDGKHILTYPEAGETSGFTYSREAANYLMDNNLAIVSNLDRPTGPFSFIVVDPDFYTSFGTHLNSDTSPVTVNPFISRLEWYLLSSSYYKDVKGIVGEPNGKDIDHYGFNAKQPTEKEDMYRIFYSEHQEMFLTDKGRVPLFDQDGEPIIRGGFHATDSEGKFLYDDEGKPVRQLYDLDLVAEDNAKFGETSITSLARFQVALQLKFVNNQIEAVIIGDSLRDSDYAKKDPAYDHGFNLTSIQVLPQLTTNRDSSLEGMIIVPDGTGALIEFNNGKNALGYSDINKGLYGYDMAFLRLRQPEQVQNIMFGMYGYIDQTNQKGIMAIVEQGGAQSSLYAGTSSANSAYYTTMVRQREDVTAGTGWNSSVFTKWTPNIDRTDLKYRYVILEEDQLGYVEVAKLYRQYLIEKYDLVEKDTTTKNLVDINFLGAYERYNMFLGIKYMTSDSLTTFAQAQSIINELRQNGVDTISVNYTSWTDKEFEYETTKNLKASKDLGGAKGLKELDTYLEKLGIGLYPEIHVSTSKGYDYSFGLSKYSAKGVGNAIAEHYPYNLATLTPDRSGAPTYYLNPAFYRPISANLIKSYDKLNVDGVFLKDLGNIKIGHYERNNEIYGSKMTALQQDALSMFAKNYTNVKLSAPFDYAFPYVTTAIDAPLQTSSYGIFDATIPFYQLVVSGLFDYATDNVNGTSDKNVDWYFVKALETGSNLRFTVSAEDPKILLETDYTQYYKSYYDNWKDTIISMNNRINQSGIHGGRLVDHELVYDTNGTVVRDISKVVYSNGVELVVNSGNIDFNYQGYIVPRYGYIKLGGE